MKKTRLKTIFILSLVLASLNVANAQTTQAASNKICFVNAQQLLAAHPMGKDVQALRDAANKEIKPIADQLTTLQTKISGGTATAADRQQFDALNKTYQATGKKWQDKINAAIEPITKDVDVAVQKGAVAEGCSIVLDKSIAASGLVVYADPNLDITAVVIKLLNP